MHSFQVPKEHSCKKLYNIEMENTEYCLRRKYFLENNNWSIINSRLSNMQLNIVLERTHSLNNLSVFKCLTWQFSFLLKKIDLVFNP